MKQRYWLCNFTLLFIGFLLLSGCVARFPVDRMPFVNFEPTSHSEQEVMLERINQALLISSFNRKERASLYFERGVIYDSLGLWELARRDFEKAIRTDNRLVGAYNYLGLYALLAQDYERAVEIFNLLLDIDPQYSYAFLNRGLAFYYAQRYHLAEQDFLQFYQRNKSDPYAVLWLYWNDLKRNPQTAKDLLQQRVEMLDDSLWGTTLAQYFLGKYSVNQLQEMVAVAQFAKEEPSKYAEVLTETYFYLAKQQLNLSQMEQAKLLFKWAIANHIYNFVEYRFALFELMTLNQSNK